LPKNAMRARRLSARIGLKLSLICRFLFSYPSRTGRRTAKKPVLL
jgi:hypothetical protein